jgi:hypothetical protein
VAYFGGYHHPPARPRLVVDALAVSRADFLAPGSCAASGIISTPPPEMAYFRKYHYTPDRPVGKIARREPSS